MLTWMQLLTDHFLVWAQEMNLKPGSVVTQADLRAIADKINLLAEEMDEQRNAAEISR